MNQDERNILANEIHETANFYGKYDLSKEDISMMLNVLQKHYSEFGLNDFLKAYHSYKQDGKNTFFPSPSQLRKYLSPEIDDDTVAISTASKVVQAVSKFGWSNASDARAFVGELGWAGVQRFGGWMAVCENLGESINLGTFQAQLREILKSEIKVQKAGSYTALEYHKDPDALLNDRKHEQIGALLHSIKGLK